MLRSCCCHALNRCRRRTPAASSLFGCTDRQQQVGRRLLVFVVHMCFRPKPGLLGCADLALHSAQPAISTPYRAEMSLRALPADQRPVFCRLRALFGQVALALLPPGQNDTTVNDQKQ